MLGARPRAVPPHPAAAAGAGAGHHAGAVLRAGVFRVPLGDPAGGARRADAGDLDRRVPGRVRAVRLLDGLGDRNDHGGVQVVIVVALLAAASLVFRGSASVGKG